MNLVLGYFDPSGGSMLIQAIMGGFGGIIVFGRYLWMQYFRAHPNHSITEKPQEVQPSTLDQTR